MKWTRWIALTTCVLGVAGAANAGTAGVSNVTDYLCNSGNHWYFWPPNVVVDHTPFYRCSLEDWGWTHDVSNDVPADATEIKSATLSILAWDVDDLAGEVDIVTVNNTQVGTLQGPSNGVPVPPVPAEAYDVTGQPSGAFTRWSVTNFTLPQEVLQDLWLTGTLDVFLDIDHELNGDRVNIRSSTLTVIWTTSGEDQTVAEPDVNVYRFWSPVLSGHFYTVSEEERDMLISQYPDVWTHEGSAYLAFSTAANASLRPIYRFWSGHSHFYTISEQEKDMLIRDFPNVWTFEGIAFYAYPEGLQPSSTHPVYRFWSDTLSKHFYTISEQEKQMILDQYSHVWQLEGVAWYAHTGEIKTHSWPNTF
ncbi:MAG: hypothetical protein JW955_24010 [Sedimentisphaerales bacterium]|nr:hypothetical protein [Sedimentisphaerales bacterium]